MRWFLRGLVLVVVLLVGSVLHYNLPQTDVVRVVGTSTKRIDFGENSFFWSAPEGNAALAGQTRDVFFIETIRTNGRPMVYRNEDTGWGWPPYFKFNSFDLQALSSSMTSSTDNPQWVAVRHYGWRNEFFSIFPNAISVRPVSGPDVSTFPWAAVSILFVLGLFVVLIWRMLARFREKVLDPVSDRVGDRIDELDARADAARARAGSRWQRFKARFTK